LNGPSWPPLSSPADLARLVQAVSRAVRSDTALAEPAASDAARARAGARRRLHRA